MTQSRREFVSTLGAAALWPVGSYLARALPLGDPAAARFKIRTITAGIPLATPAPEPIERAIAVLRRARTRFEAAGYTVEGVRITTSPFVAGADAAARLRLLADLQSLDRLLVSERVSLGIG